MKKDLESGVEKDEVREKKEIEEKKEEVKKPQEITEPQETKKTEKHLVEKREAVARGKDLRISTKQAVDICKFIKGKSPELAIKELSEIAVKKRALPMKGEIPHRHGNMMSGRYPINACKAFINLLKSLEANASVNNLQDVYIETTKADIASRPYRRGGSRRFKRTHVLLIAKRIASKETENKEKK